MARECSPRRIATRPSWRRRRRLTATPRSRAASLREGNQELIAASRIIEQLPALVEAAAHGIAGSNLTVLNGAQGVNELLADLLVGQGLSILELIKKSTATAVGELPAPDLNGKPAQANIAPKAAAPH